MIGGQTADRQLALWSAAPSSDIPRWLEPPAIRERALNVIFMALLDCLRRQARSGVRIMPMSRWGA